METARTPEDLVHAGAPPEEFLDLAEGQPGEIPAGRQDRAQKVVCLLTSLHAADPAALAALVAARVECSRALADHPSIQDDGTVSGVGLLTERLEIR